ncbi:chlorinating enzyme [Microcoleus sp. F4-D5]|uniref:chlorinating enzyme n=1 Tax=Microcoleus sp. F4-D5 TaxID=2818760 RepID=UPI002FCFFC33
MVNSTEVKSFGLSQQQREFFKENGYIGPFTLYEPNEMKDIWNKVRRQIFDRSHAVYDVDTFSGPNNIANYDRHLDVPFLGEHICRPEIVHKVRDILEPDLLCWRSEFFPKYGGDEGTDWHQADNFAMASGKEQLVWPQGGMGGSITVWTAFTEASERLGCLRFIPGSHKEMHYDELKGMSYDVDRVNKVERGGIQRGFFGYDYAELQIDDWVPDEDKAVSMEMEAGQFIVFWSKLAHSSWPNRGDFNEMRLGFASRYVPTSVKIYPDTEYLEEFGACLSLEDYGAVLVCGEDRYGHNRIRNHNTRGIPFPRA